MALSNVVGLGDVDSEVDDSVHVDMVHPTGADEDVYNQLSALTKKDVIIKECLLTNKKVVWNRQFIRVSCFIMQDCICQVADCLRDDAPLVWARLSAKP